MFKKIVSFMTISALTLCIGNLSASLPVHAEETGTYGSLYFTEYSDYIAITGFDGSEQNLTIPAEINNLPVEEISAAAFQNALKLTSIDIPSSVKTIGDRAFQGCVSLKEIVLPEDLTSLGIYAFENCSSLETVWFLFGPTYIPEGAFKNCGSLQDLHLSTAITKFYYNSYSSYKQTNIFYGCTLQDVYYAGTETQWNAITNKDAVSYSRTLYYNATTGRLKTSGDLIYSVVDDHITIMGVNATATEVTIPAKIENLPVTRIDEAAFRDATRLQKVVISEGITEIAGWAFSGCSKLTNVTLPTTLQTIGYRAFGDCINLSSIYIPSGVTTIGARAFQGCVSLKSLYFPKDLVELGVYACENCAALETVYFPNGPSYIPEGAFKNCGSLKNLYLSTTVTKFYYNSYSSYTQTNIFYGCTLQDVYYTGTKTQWNAITNKNVVSGTIHYSASMPMQSTSGKLVFCGDVNEDNTVSVEDAVATLTAYAQQSAGLSVSLTEEQKLAMDVDGNGQVTVEDAVSILTYYAKQSAGLSPTWKEVL